MMNAMEKEADSFTETYEATNTAVEKLKCETSTPLIAPRPMISQRKLNPFKKSSNANSTTGIALNHLKKKSIGYNDSAITNSDDENTPSNNLSKVNRSVSMDTPRPGNFSQWFIANKEDLKTNNKTCSDVELIKIGKNIYKELTQKTKVTEDSFHDSSLSGSFASSAASLNKRKLDMNEESVGGIAKLAKYGYTEKE